MKAKENYLYIKWSIAIKISPIITALVVLKFVFHYFKIEVMDLNPLFTSLVAGTIFIIGFLVTGVLSDYKESEKIPSEISCLLRNIYDDTQTLVDKDIEICQLFLKNQKNLYNNLMGWLYKNVTTKDILEDFCILNKDLSLIEKEGIAAPYIIKFKNEISSIRKLVLRMDTIRDTDFISSAYAIVEAMGVFVAIGLLAIDIKPFYASVFLTTLVSFLLCYMFFLIKDLDNPFDYSEKGEGGTEISLKPLHDTAQLYNKIK